MTDHGDDTRDLRRYGNQPEHPAMIEARTRRFGVVCLTTGIALPIVVYFAGLVTAVAADNNAFHTEPARLFAVLGMIALIGLGFMLVAVGGMERLLRAPRSLTDNNRILLERHIVETRERFDVIMGLLAPLPGRLTAIEDVIEKVPAYGEGVVFGVTLGRDPAEPSEH